MGASRLFSFDVWEASRSLYTFKGKLDDNARFPTLRVGRRHLRNYLVKLTKYVPNSLFSSLYFGDIQTLYVTPKIGSKSPFILATRN